MTLRAAVLCDSGTATDAYGLVVQQPAAAGQASVAFSGARHVLCTGDWQRVSIDMLNQAGQVIQDGPAFATVDGAIATVSLTRSGHA